MRVRHPAALDAHEDGMIRSGKSNSHSPVFSWLLRAALGLAVVQSGMIVAPYTASAVPSYARQTGQPCATCHTAFPELTPYGRQFKLGGYTAGGTRCGSDSGLAGYLGGSKDVPSAFATNEPQIPISFMTNSEFTHVNTKDFPNNNQTSVRETSIFIAGQLYCNLGAFVQMTYSRPDQVFGLDNADIRYANTTKLAGVDVLYGVTANQNPTVQDVWNTVPAWSFPFIDSTLAPAPAASTMIEGTFQNRVAGSGAYVWINNMVYAEISAYGALDAKTQHDLGADPTGPRFAGAAPYWRLAVEKTWDQHSLMVGTFGMAADIQPVGAGPTPTALSFPGVTDRFTDVGLDAQYQYLGDIHAFTVRGSYIWEHQKLNAEFANNASANPNIDLDSFKISASYIYDRTISLTGGYFGIRGTSDALIYADNANFSPNSNGWVADLAYMPFSKGGPKEWPWLNARIGISYTHYDKFDGTSVGASDNDTTFIYTWFAF